MRRILLISAIILLPVLGWSQALTAPTGAPSGACISSSSIAIDVTTGNVYYCSGSAWVLSSAGSTAAFSGLTSGTNTAAAMVIGTGGSLTVSGSGTNNATSLGGATFAAPGAIGGTTPAAGTFTVVNATTLASAYEINAIKILIQPDSDTTSVALGPSALGVQSSTSLNNSAVGSGAGAAVTSGSNLTLSGYNAGNAITTATDITATGFQALLNATGGDNTASGSNAGEFISTGTNNSAYGFKAMQGVTGAKTTGASNSAFGYEALLACQGACHDNVAVGATAGANITTGIENVIIGSSTTPSGGTNTNSIVIGYNLTGGGSNTVNLGGVLTATGIGTPATSTVTIPGTLAPNILNLSVLDQANASTVGGTCTMSATTTCTLSIAHTYTTPVCLITEQGISATVIAAACGVSGAVVTVTAATSNSSTFGILVFGNPN